MNYPNLLLKIQIFLKKNNLSFQGYIVLKLIEHNPLSFKDIRNQMGIKQSSMSTIKNTLIKHGLVQRYAGTKDQRSYFLQITEKGNELLKKDDNPEILSARSRQ